MPNVVYRVYTDGRPPELVRGDIPGVLVGVRIQLVFHKFRRLRRMHLLVGLLDVAHDRGAQRLVPSLRAMP